MCVYVCGVSVWVCLREERKKEREEGKKRETGSPHQGVCVCVCVRETKRQDFLLSRSLHFSGRRQIINNILNKSIKYVAKNK